MGTAPSQMKLTVSSLKRLLGSASAVTAVQNGEPVASIEQSWLPALARFQQRSQQYYLYP
jgi:hypothetical protein